MIRYFFAVIYLSVAQKEQMRILVYPHRLHSVEAVDDGQSVKSQVSILQKKKGKKNIDERNLRDERNMRVQRRTLTRLSNSILNASGPRCDILSKFSQMQVKDCVSSPNSAQIPHISPE